jgi:CO dehydrogenase maturation factor
VAGKGGVGKTLISALLINHLIRQHNGAVLAIDADPSTNLHLALGVDIDFDELESVGSIREETAVDVQRGSSLGGMSKPDYFEMRIQQAIWEEIDFDLLAMGRPEGPGCYCAANNMLRASIDRLSGGYRYVVIDNEAGLEHLSRRTTRNVDALLVVVSDNPLSLRSAEKIQSITEDMDARIRRKYIVTNMIPDAKMATVKRRLEAFRIPHLIDIPFDSALEEVIFQGEPLKNLEGSPIMKTIQNIIETVGGKDADS